MKAAVIADDWKLPIFRKILTKAGYKFEDGGRFAEGVSLLTVETDVFASLKTVVQQCERECRKQKYN